MEAIEKNSMLPGQHNRVHIRGRILEEPQFSNQSTGIRFYSTRISVYRKSETTDTIPLLLPEAILEEKGPLAEKVCDIYGQFRSYNKVEKERNHLLLSVLTKELEVIREVPKSSRFAGGEPVLREESFWETGDTNQVYLEGYVCRKVQYRKTPLGREIADVLLAVPRMYGKNDYLPCISWGRNARETARLPVGTRVAAEGRIQSRLYVKHSPSEGPVIRQAFEISLTNLKVLPKENR